MAGGKGFGTPSILDYLPLKKFDLADARHVDLAIMSRRFHQITVISAPPDDERETADRLAEDLLNGRG